MKQNYSGVQPRNELGTTNNCLIPAYTDEHCCLTSCLNSVTVYD
jgi:hypothetical protein